MLLAAMATRLKAKGASLSRFDSCNIQLLTHWKVIIVGCCPLESILHQVMGHIHAKGFSLNY